MNKTHITPSTIDKLLAFVANCSNLEQVHQVKAVGNPKHRPYVGFTPSSYNKGSRTRVLGAIWIAVIHMVELLQLFSTDMAYKCQFNDGVNDNAMQISELGK